MHLDLHYLIPRFIVAVMVVALIVALIRALITGEVNDAGGSGKVRLSENPGAFWITFGAALLTVCFFSYLLLF